METSTHIHEQVADEEGRSLEPALSKESLADMAESEFMDSLRHLADTLVDQPQAIAQLEALCFELTGLKIEKLRSYNMISEERALSEIDRLRKKGASANQVGTSLAGFDSDEAWDLREELFACGESSPDAYLALPYGLAMLDSPRSWEMRERLRGKMNEKDYFEKLAESLVGVDSAEAWQTRLSIISKGTMYYSYVISSLAGLDCARAWEMRERLYEGDLESTAQSLAGLDSEKAWKMRERLQLAECSIYSLVSGVAAVDSPEAWRFRRDLLNDGKFLAPKKNRLDIVARSLAGLNTPEAWELRESLLGEDINKEYIALGLAGLDSRRAREMRSRLEQMNLPMGTIAQSLNGYHHAAVAWRAAKGLLPYQQEQKT